MKVINEVYETIKFTCEQIDFLDTTVFKGPNLKRLVKTLVKPTNKQLYGTWRASINCVWWAKPEQGVNGAWRASINRFGGAFAGFMCCDELIKLKCNDITFNDQIR